MESPTSPFYFELSANGEHTKFKEVEGISTDVVLKRNLNPGDHPFTFRLPSLPKNTNLVLKHGQCNPNSKLMQWCTQSKNPEEATEKNQATLSLKDNSGKSLLEWTLYRAHPVNSKAAIANSKTQVTEIEDLELGYSFFTLQKK